MTRDEITSIAREAGFVGMDAQHGALRRFAALVAAAERRTAEGKLLVAQGELARATAEAEFWKQRATELEGQIGEPL